MPKKKFSTKDQDKDKKSVSKKIWNGMQNVGMVVLIPVNLLYHFGKFVFSKDFWKD